MKANRSNVFMLSASDFALGTCDVCAAYVLLVSKDVSTGWRIGKCCIEAALQADIALNVAFSERQPEEKKPRA